MSRILFCGILCAGFLVAQPLHAYTFTRSLTRGSAGIDVRELQKVLNRDPQTQIAVSGAGSPGNETSTFGNLTRLAVIKFQQKYPTDILQPAGLVFGNGYVGPLTIKKLNAFQHTASNQAPIPFISADKVTDFKVKASEKTDIYATDKKIKAIQDQFNAELNRAMAARVAPALGSIVDTATRYVPPVIVSSVSSIIAKPGSKIVISGRGFDSSSVIYLGNDYIIRNPQITAGSITFTLPSIPYDKYDLAVKTSKDMSNSVFFIVAPTTSSGVSVSSIKPSPVRFGETMTITGTGFTPQNNEIHSPVGIIKGISSSDGKTLSFTFSPDVFKEMAKYSQNSRTQPLHVWVVNSNGYTQAKEFVLSY
ncbi:MAG: IPT/TIG domain-containing protein [bacterium]|nr:IPT/TIG domain-containing protein [bacterium]